MNTLEQNPTQGWLSWFLRGVLFLVAIILFTRLAELQIIKGNYYKALSDGNRIRRVPILAPRGKIIGSDGQLLAGNIDIKEKIVFTKDGFEKSLDIDNADSSNIITESKRNYYLAAAAAHITGYLGEANPNEVNKVNPDCKALGPLKIGSMIGRSGLEEEYECLLHGIDGEQLIEVDALGNPVRVLGIKNPIPGKDLITTIDPSLELKVASIIQNQKKLPTPSGELPAGKRAAVVVSDGSGKILALYSSPSYNPNIFINKNSQLIEDSLNDPYLPLFNRAIDGLYHPGSTFKIVTATAGLEEGKIDENFIYNDTGSIKIGDAQYTTWYFTQHGKVEGEINLVKAIARSTDTFFYKLGEMIGINDLSDWAIKFRLNKKTGLDLPNEAEGLIPTPAWKRQVKGELWFLGDTYNVSIGQGDVALTPLAVNLLTAVIANHGKICTPYINANLKPSCTSLNLHPKTLDLIKEGMVGACSEGGTAFPFFDAGSGQPNSLPKVACKTGTAETGDNGKTHAWFAAFAPADNPKIVIDVIIENGGEGSSVAAPIAKEILQYYFGKK